MSHLDGACQLQLGQVDLPDESESGKLGGVQPTAGVELLLTQSAKEVSLCHQNPAGVLCVHVP